MHAFVSRRELRARAIDCLKSPAPIFSRRADLPSLGISFFFRVTYSPTDLLPVIEAVRKNTLCRTEGLARLVLLIPPNRLAGAFVLLYDLAP